MSDRGERLEIVCPECGGEPFAAIPQNSEIVDSETEADTGVWVNCENCEAQFRILYRLV